MVLILFSPPALWPEYAPHLPPTLAAAGLAGARVVTEAPDPEAVDYIVFAPSSSGIADFTPFRRAKAVLSLWAGVEQIVGNRTLTQPLCRMVAPGMTEGMVEWVTGHVLRHHLGMDAYIVNPGHQWSPQCPPLARNRPVAVLGVGALGLAVARTLQGLNFAVTGWGRSPRKIEGLATDHGPEGLARVLSRAQIVVTLLPDTPATENILNANTLALLPEGAVIINPGRGPLIDDAALIAALDSGRVGHATLDVFRTEPLPAGHPFWAHPRVTVTPHVAAATRPDDASPVLAENIRRGEAGLPFLHVVDRSHGY